MFCFADRIQKISAFLCMVLLGAAYAAPAAYADIALKVVVVNPSDAQSKKAKIKAYLPDEIGPAEVVSSGDLKVMYDAEKGHYYVYGETDLAPKESTEREVLIKDVWRIDEKVVAAKRKELQEIVRRSAENEFSGRIEAIAQAATAKLDRIVATQKTPADSPQQHISAYRANCALLNEVDTDLAAVRTLLLNVKRLPQMHIWTMIVIVLAFLGALSGLMFLFWQRQEHGGNPFKDSEETGGRFYQDLRTKK